MEFHFLCVLFKHDLMEFGHNERCLLFIQLADKLRKWQIVCRRTFHMDWITVALKMKLHK